MSEKKDFKHSAFVYGCYRIILRIVKLVYPRMGVEGAENLPDEPCIVVGNHSQINGPIACELYFPGQHTIWCAGQMMELKEVPPYAYADFWSHKPPYIRWFFKLASYLIAPISVCVFNNAHTIPVYHDTRILTTFRRTFEALNQGQSVVIFPECADERNNIVNQFQMKFVDVARLYYKRSGKALKFVPLYIAPKLKKLYLGEPVTFDPSAPIESERQRICDYLADSITCIARTLPEHVVVPYNNVSKKLYKTNISSEVEEKNEKACS